MKEYVLLSLIGKRAKAFMYWPATVDLQSRF